MTGSPYELKFLSPYSYMLNPAGSVYSKVKASAKRILSGRVVELTLSGVIQDSAGMIPQQNCANDNSDAVSQS
uniref:Uncharacterized protein n=1 Tax=Plectus sambesii TaxID=2011161 RepID=A0A914WYD1_9BILA